MVRTHLSALLFVTSCLLSACGGCGPQAEGCPQGCDVFEACVQGQCISIVESLCVPSCGANESCQQGMCVPVGECTAPGQTCDYLNPVSNNFYCIDWDGLQGGNLAQCSNPCQSDGSCPSGSNCFLLTVDGPPSCQSQSDCGFGTLCLGGECLPASCKPSECEGLLEGQETCERLYAEVPRFASGARCVPTENDANYCVPAGNQEEGAACLDLATAARQDDFSFTCQIGLECVQGNCRQTCGVDADCEVPGQACLFVEEDIVTPGVGFCGRACPSFEVGSCEVEAGETGQKCLPVTGEDGYCVPAGEVPAFDSCSPGQWQCEDGTYCVTYREREGGLTGPLVDARCMPMCNVTVAPMGDATSVSRTDQVQRDATCPQPEEIVVSYVTVVHVAQAVAEVDVYLGDDPAPWISGLKFGERAVGVSGSYLEVSPGAATLSVRPAGTPVLEAPIAEFTVSLRRNEGRRILLAAASPQESEELVFLDHGVEPPAEVGGRRLVHAIPDAPEFDVWASEPGMAVDTGEELVAGVSYKDVVTLPVRQGARDLHLVRAREEAGEPLDVLVTFGSVEINSEPSEVWITQGTLEPDDILPVQGLTKLPIEPVPLTPRGGPRMFCSDLGNGVFGMCEQTCEDASDYSGTWCDGQVMACTPNRLPGFLGWRGLCRPAGLIAIGEPCDPTASVGECAEGSYCLDYGAGAEGLMAPMNGRCTPLCVVDDPENPTLACGDGQSCRPVDDDTFEVGQCGFPCEPGSLYADQVSCPAGLASCKPSARLVEDQMSAGELPPVVEQLPTFCSASGTLPRGQSCTPGACEPGTECLFDRGPQEDLVSTLLSPYFGGVGLALTCKAQCDPFDAVRSSVRCGPDETCLVNYPWSADVGHCAPIVERVPVNQPCSRPGESCGDDSVCVVDGGLPYCMRLCEYVGGPSRDRFEQSTCPAGLECAPLVNDIGLCRAPGQ